MRVLLSAGFILAGLFLLFYPQWETAVSAQKQEQLIVAFEQLSNVSEQIETAASEDPPAPQIQEPLAMLEGARGVIRIPKIDLKMMIFEGADKHALSKGVGLVEPDKEFGVNNVGLAGHRGITHGKQFNRLDELAPNDEIEIKTKTATYQFVVVKAFVVDRTQVEVLEDQKKPLITLVTCTPVGAKDPKDRLIVQAEWKQTTSSKP